MIMERVRTVGTAGKSITFYFSFQCERSSLSLMFSSRILELLLSWRDISSMACQICSTFSCYLCKSSSLLCRNSISLTLRSAISSLSRFFNLSYFLLYPLACYFYIITSVCILSFSFSTYLILDANTSLCFCKCTKNSGLSLLIYTTGDAGMIGQIYGTSVLTLLTGGKLSQQSLTVPNLRYFLQQSALFLQLSSRMELYTQSLYSSQIAGLYCEMGLVQIMGFYGSGQGG